jgi:hypothetical protein
MAAIVAIDTGEKGRLLCAAWRLNGNHATSESVLDLPGASVVLYGGGDLSKLVEHTNAQRTVVIDCRSASALSSIRSLTSESENLAATLPNASVVKAFNALTTDAIAFVSSHDSPQIGSVYPSGFYCGDDNDAKRVVAGLITEVNFDPVDCGSIENAPLLDSLSVLVEYLRESTVSPFTVTIVGGSDEQRSPLDRWM